MLTEITRLSIKKRLIIHFLVSVAVASAMVATADASSVQAPSSTSTELPEVLLAERASAKTLEETTTVPQSKDSVSLTVEETIAIYFSDAPIMKKVAWCESRNRQYDETGAVIRGVVNPLDVGAFQINEKYHLDTANKLGINVYTLEGNMEYARYLYETQGTRPWVHSSPCWDNQVALNG